MLLSKIQKSVRLICVIFILAFLVSCISIPNPQPPWFEPVNLNLSPDELADVTIELECGVGSDQEIAWVPRRGRACRQVADLIEGFGAELIIPDDDDDQSDYDEDQEENEDGDESEEEDLDDLIDFSVVYVERTEGGEADSSEFDTFRFHASRAAGHPVIDNSGGIMFGWSLLPCLMTGTLFPCQDTVEAWAELMIYDSDQNLRKRIPLRTKVTDYVGIGALFIMIGKRLNPDLEHFYDKVIPRRLGEYIVNSVVTYNTNRKLIVSRGRR